MKLLRQVRIEEHDKNLSIQSGLISSVPGVAVRLHLAFTLWQHSKFNRRYCMKTESAPNRKMTEERHSATLHKMTGLVQLTPQISGSSGCPSSARNRDYKEIIASLLQALACALLFLGLGTEDTGSYLLLTLGSLKAWDIRSSCRHHVISH